MMFWILQLLPSKLWLILPILGIIAIFASHFFRKTPYYLISIIFGYTTLALSLFIGGVIFSNKTWQARVEEMQAKVVQLEKKSQEVNTVIEEKLITKTKTVVVRGQDIIKYIDRELIKYDITCEIPQEFITAHNNAAEEPK